MYLTLVKVFRPLKLILYTIYLMPPVVKRFRPLSAGTKLLILCEDVLGLAVSSFIILVWL